jgi:hypothetical protein
MNDDTITLGEAAKLLNVSEIFVKNLVSDGTLSLRNGKLSRAQVLDHRRVRNRERESALQEILSLGEEHDHRSDWFSPPGSFHPLHIP